MKVYFGKDSQDRILIGERDTCKECRKLIYDCIKEQNLYSAPYRREWIYENELIIDYGSHVTFFFVGDCNPYEFMESIVQD